MGAMQFLKQFVFNPGKTGAVAASSEGLANLITDSADLAHASAVIEFGPGTGVFTEKILQKINPGAAFFALEINPEFVAATRKRCPGATVHHDTAVNAPRYLADLGLDHCDSIVCGLPWAAFPEDLQTNLLTAIQDVLRPGGVFVTFAYLQGLLLPAGQRFRRKLRSAFSEVVMTRTVWLNMPPAFVYRARK
jgi:phosphatidylethanolamine/phosphatidyl-N-methylethanolamine N-methyltransferase